MNPQAKIRQSSFQGVNLAVLLAIAAAGLGLLHVEGYVPLVRAPFALYGIAVSIAACWAGSFELSRRRLLLMVGIASAIGLLTQHVGADLQGLWTYQGPRRSYFFVTAVFSFVAVLVYGVTVLGIGPRLQRSIGLVPREVNLLVVGAMALVVIVGAAPHRHPGALAFWAYYLALIAFAGHVARRMTLASLLAVAGSAILIGALSETLGAWSGLWRFTDGGTWPPAYLILGSWPLEMLFSYGLSALMAGERLETRQRWFQEDRIYEEDRAHPMWTGNGPHTVASAVHDDKFTALDEVLEKSGFFEAVERRRAALGKERAELRIAVKPNLMFLYSEEDRSTFTDPALVEHLIDRLRERGYRDIAVVESQSAYGNYFLDREVPNVARVAGYRPEGRYRIVDLTAEKVPHRFRGPLGEHLVGPTWRDADFRISFAKNKTHTWALYTLTIKNIYGALAAQDKLREYHQRREIYYPAIDMLLELPVHFGLIDAHLSADGPFGIFADRRPNPTRTVIGGENLVAVDQVGARKMGLDPMVSRYMQLAVQAFGQPEIRLVGDGSVYAPWVNVPKPLADFWDTAEESYSFTNTVFMLLNREAMSPAFRKRPTTALLAFLSRALAPIGRLVYHDKAPALASTGDVPPEISSKVASLPIARFDPEREVRQLRQECFLPHAPHRVSSEFRRSFLYLLPDHLQWTRLVTEGPLHPGSRVVATPMVLTRPMVAVEIVEFDDDGVAYAYLDGGPLVGRNVIRFSPHPDGTVAQVTLEYQLGDLPTALGWSLLGGEGFHRKLIAEGFKALDGILSEQRGA